MTKKLDRVLRFRDDDGSMEEDGVIQLRKAASSVGVGLKRVRVNLGWSPAEPGSDIVCDLDLSCLVLNADRRMESGKDLIFYGNRISPDGSVVHSTDDTEGNRSDGGPDEWIDLDLHFLPHRVHQILFVVSVYNHDGKNISLGDIDDIFIQIKNDVSQAEIHHREIEGVEFAGRKCLEIGSLVRCEEEWEFVMTGLTHERGLESVIELYSNLRCEYEVSEEEKIIDMNATSIRRATNRP